MTIDSQKVDCREQARTGFSLIELLVVIAIIAILAGLILAAVTRSRASGQKTECISNQKQLVTTWAQYPVDRNDELVANWHWRVRGKRYVPWVTGVGHPNTSAMTDISFLMDEQFAAFAPYLKKPEIYKCPSNREKVEGTEAIRSYAMNQYMGCYSDRAFDTNYARFTTAADIPEPTQYFVFADINQKFVCFPFMILDMQKDEWHHPPATAHNYGGTLSFADGHVEYKRWLEDTTKGIAWHSSWNIGPHKTPVKAGDRDLAWIRERQTFRLN